MMTIRAMSRTTITQHIFLRTCMCVCVAWRVAWCIPAPLPAHLLLVLGSGAQLLHRLPCVVDRLSHRVLYLVEQLALRLDEHRHVHEELVELLDRALEPCDVLVPFLDIRECVARRRVPWPLEELLREYLRLLAALYRLLDLVLGRRRLDDPQLTLDTVAVLVLVLGLYLLVLCHQVDELARQRAVHVRAYPRLARALVALGELSVLEVHCLELVAHRLRGAVGFLHEPLEAVGALALLLRRDGREALAVVLLDQPDVVLDRLHRLLHGVHLLEEACHC